MKISFLFLGLFACFAFFNRTQLLDTGQELFFPQPTFHKIQNFSKFQIASWNNIILSDEQQAIKLCRELRRHQLVSKVMCQPGLSDFTSLVKSYLQDQFLIFPAPRAKALQESAAMEMAKLTVLMGPESGNILELIRLDPLNRKEALLGKVQNIMNENFIWQNGLLIHKSDKTIIIPFQLSYRPDEISRTRDFQKLLDKYNAVMIGVHEGHLSNRSAIENDLDSIGIISSLMIALFLGFVAYLRLFKLVKLIVPTMLGISVSFLITWLIYGRVHGITLSFGTGIIGLAIDYGFHYVFSKDKQMAWKSNLYALLTTLVVFIIFLFSHVPLIRQMMVFSTIGLMASYLFSRLLLVNDHIAVNMDITLKKSKWHALSILMVLVGIFHMIFLKVDTSMARFNYSPPPVKEAQQWFYKQVKKEKIFFKVYEENEFASIAPDHQQLADSIRSESVYSYIPYAPIQQQNLNSWLDFRKSGFQFEGNEEKIFQPFTEQLQELSPQAGIDLKRPPEYLAHLAKDNKVISMWFAKNKQQEELIKSKLEGVDSLIDIVMGFTYSLSQEVSRFMPITLLAIWILLMFRYMNVKKSLICLIPFLFSLGLYGMLYRYFNFPLSFMSLLGLFLIYGLSVDYGIFSTDFFTDENHNSEEESSLNLGLLVNWISGIVGFIPLLWCDHPILNDLGLVLIVGMLGIFYSTFFVIPSLFLLGGKK